MPACTRSPVSMLTDFFASDHIEATARRTGFVKRASKITGKLFLALVTFGPWHAVNTTLAQLAAKADAIGPARSQYLRKRIHQRMHKKRHCFSSGHDPSSAGQNTNPRTRV